MSIYRFRIEYLDANGNEESYIHHAENGNETVKEAKAKLDDDEGLLRVYSA